MRPSRQAAAPASSSATANRGQAERHKDGSESGTGLPGAILFWPGEVEEPRAVKWFRAPRLSASNSSPSARASKNRRNNTLAVKLSDPASLQYRNLPGTGLPVVHVLAIGEDGQLSVRFSEIQSDGNIEGTWTSLGSTPSGAKILGRSPSRSHHFFFDPSGARQTHACLGYSDGSLGLGFWDGDVANPATWVNLGSPPSGAVGRPCGAGFYEGSDPNAVETVLVLAQNSEGHIFVTRKRPVWTAVA